MIRTCTLTSMRATIYHDLGIPSVDNTEPLILNELQDDEYRSIVQMLNREQKEFFITCYI